MLRQRTHELVFADPATQTCKLGHDIRVRDCDRCGSVLLQCALTGKYLERSVGKRRLVLLYALLVLFVVGNSQAEMVADLYAATVPVADQSEQALSTAARQGLAEVLVKVSGSSQLLKNPEIVGALGQARSHVQQYYYVRGETAAAELLVRFDFDGAFVTDLVRKSGAPLWTANRPVALAWVVLDGEQGKQLVSWDSTPLQAQQLVDAFSRRGVPVQIPVFDLNDMTAVSAENVWRLDRTAIVAASARYNVQDVIAGRLASPSGGKFTGDWSYFYQGDRVNRSATVPDVQAFLRAGAGIVAGEMSARYALSPTVGGEGELRMLVTGVSSYADYAAIVRWLEELELVEHANIRRVQGEQIELQLQAQLNASQLAGLIELNNQLLPASPPGSTAQLNYQWQK